MEELEYQLKERCKCCGKKITTLEAEMYWNRCEKCAINSQKEKEKRLNEMIEEYNHKNSAQ